MKKSIKRMNIGTLSTTFAMASDDAISHILEAELEKLKNSATL